MLLTHLSSLNLDLSRNIITNDDLRDALRKLLPTSNRAVNPVEPNRDIVDTYSNLPVENAAMLPAQVEPQIALSNVSELNIALWGFIENITDGDTVGIDRILAQVDSFDIFDEKTWVLLHLICAQDNIAQFRTVCIYVQTWLKNNATSKNAMQARLFLMSQPKFSFTSEDLKKLIIEPILASEDDWAWYALLAYPGFEMHEYDCKALKENLPSALEIMEDFQQPAGKEVSSRLWIFVKSSGVSNDVGSTVLLNNLVALNITGELLNCRDAETLTAIIKLSNRVAILTPEAKKFLSTLWGKLVSKWDTPTYAQQQELFALHHNAAAWKKKNDKIKPVNAEEIINQFVYMIQRGMLDNILANGDPALFGEKINEALGFPAATFFCGAFAATFWDKDNNFQRRGNESSVNWLLSLNIFKEFIFCKNKRDSGTIFAAGFDANDTYFIAKFFKPFCALSKENFSVAIVEIAQYAALPTAHERFKAQPQVKQILDLEYIFVTATSAAQLAGLNYHLTLHHPETFVRALKYHYAPKLIAAITTNQAIKNPKSESDNNLAYKRIKRTNKLVAQLTDVRLKTQLENETWYALFRLKYRLGRYERMEAKWTKAIKGEDSKRALKMIFVDYLIKRLSTFERRYDNAMKTGDCSYLPPMYELYYMTNNGEVAEMSDIKKWFLEVVLHNTPWINGGKGSYLAQTLAGLPDSLIEKIFERSGITHEEIWKKGYPNIPFTPAERAAARLAQFTEDVHDDDTSSEMSAAIGNGSPPSPGLSTSNALYGGPEKPRASVMAKMSRMVSFQASQL